MNKLKHAIGILALASTTSAFASYEIEINPGHKIAFGGYIKADMRYVNGDVAYQDLWLGNVPSGSMVGADVSTLGMGANESRFNMKYTHDDVSAFVEYDFYGGGGNEIVSNSVNPRIRHAFIKYNNFLVGQTWTTFMSTAAIPETLDFAGPSVGEAFIRQSMLRYSMNGFEFAIENPETHGDAEAGAHGAGVGLSGTANADPGEKMPDLVGKYTFKGDWGQVSLAALIRKIDQGVGGLEEVATAFSVAGKVMVGMDDIRFQLHVGEPGRYVGTAFTTDVVSGQVEETTAFTLAYRHLWNSDMRSSFFIGNAQSDVGDLDRTHWGLNLLNSVNKHLTVGVEVGNYEIGDMNIDSSYLQGSVKFAI